MTNAEFAILSLIVEAPRHGYEIEQIIDERGMREWTEVGFSSIYYLLKKLETGELIEGRTEVAAGRGPARKVYTSTAAGLDACRQATIDALRTMHRAYPPLQLGMANMALISQGDALAALQEHRDELQQRLETVRERRDSSEARPAIVDAMFDYSETMVEAEMGWIDRFIEQLDGGKS